MAAAIFPITIDSYFDLPQKIKLSYERIVKIISIHSILFFFNIILYCGIIGNIHYTLYYNISIVHTHTHIYVLWYMLYFFIEPIPNTCIGIPYNFKFVYIISLIFRSTFCILFLLCPTKPNLYTYNIIVSVIPVFERWKQKSFRCNVTVTHGLRCGYDYNKQYRYIYMRIMMFKPIEYIFLLQCRQSVAAEHDTGLHWRDGTVVFMFLTSTWVLIARWTFVRMFIRRRKPLIIKYYYWRYNETFEEKWK